MDNAFASQAKLSLKKADAVINFDRLLSFPQLWATQFVLFRELAVG